MLSKEYFRGASMSMKPEKRLCEPCRARVSQGPSVPAMSYLELGFPHPEEKVSKAVMASACYCLFHTPSLLCPQEQPTSSWPLTTERLGPLGPLDESVSLNSVFDCQFHQHAWSRDELLCECSHRAWQNG